MTCFVHASGRTVSISYDGAMRAIVPPDYRPLSSRAGRRIPPGCESAKHHDIPRPFSGRRPSLSDFPTIPRIFSPNTRPRAARRSMPLRGCRRVDRPQVGIVALCSRGPSLEIEPAVDTENDRSGWGGALRTARSALLTSFRNEEAEGDGASGADAPQASMNMNPPPRRYFPSMAISAGLGSNAASAVMTRNGYAKISGEERSIGRSGDMTMPVCIPSAEARPVTERRVEDGGARLSPLTETGRKRYPLSARSSAGRGRGPCTSRFRFSTESLSSRMEMRFVFPASGAPGRVRIGPRGGRNGSGSLIGRLGSSLPLATIALMSASVSTP